MSAKILTSMHKNIYYGAFITVDYDGERQSSFQSITVTRKRCDKYLEKDLVFSSIDPLVAWYNFYKWLYTDFYVNNQIFSISCSSSVDHWFIDGDKYLEKHFDPKTLEIVEEKIEDETYPCCIVTEDIKNYSELKAYVESKKKKKYPLKYFFGFKKFLYDCNLWFGWINSREELYEMLRVLEAHYERKEILASKCLPDDLSHFGLRSEYKGKGKLEDFLKENGVEVKHKK